MAPNKDGGASGYPAAILRFAIFVPFGIYYATSGQHWNNIKKHDVLQQPPYSPAIGYGEHIAAKWSKIGYIWNFAIWIPNVVFRGPLVFAVGIFDTAIATMLGIAAHAQTTHQPHTFKACKFGGAETWGVPNGTESFFTVAGRLNHTVSSAERMCRDYVQEWQYSISIVSIYSAIALCNLIFSIMVTVRSARTTTSQAYRKSFIDSVLALPRLIIWILMGIAFIPVLFFRCLPIPIKSRVRFGTRYGAKIVDVVPQPEEIKMRMMRPKDVLHYDTQGDYDTSTSPLLDLLNYDILVLIARDLCYVDLVNLSLASKSLRDVVFPGAEHTTRSHHFQMYTCDPATKTTCWNCTLQTCQYCGNWSSIPQTPTVFHLDGCEPYCSSCYFSNVCARKGKSMDTTECGCAPKNPPNWLKKFIFGKRLAAPRGLITNNAPPRLLCGMCLQIGAEGVAPRRENRSRAELRDPDRCRTCAKCGLGLGRGVRWWVNKNCGKECRSRLHLPWGILGKARDEEG